MKILIVLFKGCKKICTVSYQLFGQIVSYVLMKLNGVVIGKGFKSRGIPIVDVSLKGSFILGKNFVMNNGKRFNKIGRQQQCIFFVGKNAILEIGNNVGISATAIVCDKHIKIGNDVKIGGNVVIYDTDFHPLDPTLRKVPAFERHNTNKKEVIIGNSVFIGAHSTLLKGVHIGENSIIGAGSVVTKSIPDNEIWGGNPAKFIRKL